MGADPVVGDALITPTLELMSEYFVKSQKRIHTESRLGRANCTEGGLLSVTAEGSLVEAGVGCKLGSIDASKTAL